MTILEAIEKAKKLRDAHSYPAHHAGAFGSPGRTTRRAGRATDAAPAVPIELPRRELDREVCERNRVLVPAQRPYKFSVVVDAYRIVRTRLMQSQAPDTDRLAIFGVTSAGAGEGKTVTSINLAFACARERKRNVFLLDLDLRNPSVCRYMGVTPPAEIGAVLIGSALPSQAFFSVGIDNLVVCGGTTNYENSSELLGGKGLSAMFDYIFATDPRALVIVDLPPVLLAADALVVTPRLSAAVLVVSEGLTRRVQLARAVEVLSDVKIAGIVLNRSRESAEDYYS